MNLDAVTPVAFPDAAAWAAMYAKFFAPLVGSLSRAYCLADREDAVEEAFHKLMHKKDRNAYEKEPETEKDWFYVLRWQARAYLSHMKDRLETHAKYVESCSKALADVFACGHQGEAMDADIRTRALARALETLKAEQDISKRNLGIYVSRIKDGVPSKVVAEMHHVTANNVDQIAWRVMRLVRKHGPRHFEAALRREGYGYVA